MNSKFIVPWDTQKALFQIGSFRADPTYHEVIDWLESKDIYIDCKMYPCYYSNKGWMEYIAYVNEYNGERFIDRRPTRIYHSREEALNEAINMAIEIIERNNNNRTTSK